MSPASGQVTITPLGGFGEIGLNCMVLETEENMLVVDCGLMFPDDYLLGVDVVIPRFDYILEKKDKLRGIILTHGHEDHIGALPWLMNHLDTPLYGSGFTLALAENRLREHGLDKYTTFHPVEAGQRVEFGDLACTFIRVCHSIIQGFGLGIETPAGTIVHTGDFKIDLDPSGGNYTDMDAFKALGDSGVQLLFSDSTNIEREGHSLGESEIEGTLGEIFENAQGRILVTLFSSHIQRMQEVFNIAASCGRKVAVNGRSIMTNIETAVALDFMTLPKGVFVGLEELPQLPDNKTVLLVTGSQGEPLSALTRIAAGEHKQLNIHPGDTVILSSRFIPGNVKAITRVINNLYRLGAEVLYERVGAIHASGHAYRGELKQMIETVRPKFFVPMHGEYRHLVKHCRLANECGVPPERTIPLENGNPLTLYAGGGVRFEEKVPVESIYVDGKGVGDVGHTVLKERQLLGGGGLVIASMVIEEESWEIIYGPEVESKGFVFEQHYSHILEDAQCIILDIFENIPPGEVVKLKDRIRSSLRRFFRKVLERDPVVLPVVIVI